MKKSGIKMCTTALALAACLAAPVALAACGEKTGGTAGGGSGKGDKCTVTFDAGRGTLFGNRIYRVDVGKGQTVAEPSEDPVSDGEFFLGWSMSSGGDGAMWNFDSEKVMSDMTLYAVWARACTVTFDADGGTFANGKGTYTVTVADGSKLTAPEVTAPTDRVLGGWSDGYIVWDFATDTVDRDTTLTATWELTAELETALEPFTYTESASGFTVTGIKDKNATSVVVPSCVTEIEEEAFKDCAELTSVVINDSVKSIGSGAFNGCAKLRTVTLPSSLTRIENSTFGGCASLPEIDIPDTVKYVGASAFSGCALLKSVILPVGVTALNNYLFNGCSSLESVEIKGAVTSINYRAFYGCAKLTDFDIPSIVTEIGQLAFYGCSSLQTVDIPEACEIVDVSAFRKCAGLKSASVNCATVGDGAFMECSALEKITIGANVKTIEGSAFSDCASLASAAIPDTVTSLGRYAFNKCTSLKSVTLGRGITVIDSNTFSGCVALRKVEMQGAIAEINAYAFSDCNSLTSFTVPESVTDVNRSAFADCRRLKEILNKSSLSLSFSGGINVITDSAESKITTDANGYVFYYSGQFDYKYSLIDYVGASTYLNSLPQNYNGEKYKIDSYAFAFNDKLKSITFPSTAEKIDATSLYRSSGLETIEVEAGNINYRASGNCLIKINGTGMTNGDALVIGCKNSTIPADASLDSIGYMAFADVKGLAELEIPSNIKQIAVDAFKNCDGLLHTEGNIAYLGKWAITCSYEEKDSTIELAPGTVGVADNFVPIGSQRNIVKLVCNSELKYIGGSAFFDCRNLATVVFNDGLESLGANAFTNTALTEAVLPDSVKKLGSAFRNCTKLSYAKLPEGVTEVHDYLFSGCSALKEVVIPSSVTEIRYYAFYNCTLSKVYFGGTESEWNAVRKQSNNGNINTVSVVYYSSTSQSGCWHFGADGKPVMW
jgi:hypothetical protein